jgi:uncharacterized lipoprotein YddW (UPF0748 family)
MDSREKIEKFVNDAKENGFNTLFVQVLGRGIAYYKSAVLPTIEADFDPLAETVEKGHKKGLKVHAWLNAYYVWSSEEAPSQASHVLNSYPEWLLPNSSNMIFMDPTNRNVQEYLHYIYSEVARNYDVDGIHLDYIRFPDNTFNYDKKSPTYSIVAQNRANYVTALVKRIYQSVKKEKPNISVSAAVYPDLYDAATDKGQDWKKWQKDGIVDFVVPMIYSSDPAKVRDMILLDASISSGSSVVIGLGAFNNAAADINSYLKTYKHFKKYYRSIKGFSLFSYDSISQTPTYFEKIRKDVF